MNSLKEEVKKLGGVTVMGAEESGDGADDDDPSKKVIKILWYSKYPWVKQQEEWLNDYFRDYGRVKLSWQKDYMKVENLLDMYYRERFDYMVFVGALNVLEVLCRYKVNPLRALTHQIPDSEAGNSHFSITSKDGNRVFYYKTEGFEQVTSVTINQTEHIELPDGDLN